MLALDLVEAVAHPGKKVRVRREDGAVRLELDHRLGGTDRLQGRRVLHVPFVGGERGLLIVCDFPKRRVSHLIVPSFGGFPPSPFGDTRHATVEYLRK